MVDGRQGQVWNYDGLCACSFSGASASFILSFGKRAAKLEFCLRQEDKHLVAVLFDTLRALNGGGWSGGGGWYSRERVVACKAGEEVKEVLPLPFFQLPYPRSGCAPSQPNPR